jgi:hypothetical protein
MLLVAQGNLRFIFQTKPIPNHQVMHNGRIPQQLQESKVTMLHFSPKLSGRKFDNPNAAVLTRPPR